MDGTGHQCVFYFFLLLYFSLYKKRIDGAVSAMWTSPLYRAKTLSRLCTYIHIHTSTNLLRYKKNTRKNDQVTGGSFSSFCRSHSNYTRREVFSRGEWTVRFFSLSLSSLCRGSTFKRPVRRPTLIHYVLIERARQVAFSFSTYTLYSCLLRTYRMRTRKNIYI
jgi:hypothetical protein